MDRYLKEVGDRIRQARLKKGINQAQLAEIRVCNLNIIFEIEAQVFYIQIKVSCSHTRQIRGTQFGDILIGKFGKLMHQETKEQL